MPANPKYLTKKGHQRAAKISAGLLGGYLIAAALHLHLSTLVPDQRVVWLTSIFSLFLVWMLLFILPFMAKNGWKVWGLYLFIALLLWGGYYI